MLPQNTQMSLDVGMWCLSMYSSYSFYSTQKEKYFRQVRFIGEIKIKVSVEKQEQKGVLTPKSKKVFLTFVPENVFYF